ncbi:MAG: TetR/AcrR family transcriptional regulator [bacterium]|nr:TetR/AcrR family transcriptional regulator [bacterium]
MKRQQHEEEVRGRIIFAARRLFIARGFANTTIRQIISSAKITTGSLYHFFKNKEEILKFIVREVFQSSADRADHLAGKTEDVVFRFALEIGLQIKVIARNRPVAELYRVAYHSHSITKLLMENAAERNQELFGQFHPEWNCEDFYFRSLAVKGLLQDTVGARLEDAEFQILAVSPQLLAHCLGILGVPPERIQRGLNRALRKLDLPVRPG